MFGNRNARKAERELVRERRMREHGYKTLEVAAEYLAASIAGDEERLDAAVIRIDPDVLDAAVGELAKRAIVALAERSGTHVDEVVRSLVGPPP